jgi:glycosyltransferase involved in cell wall biosynthesis
MVAHFIPWKRHDRFIESAALIRKTIPETHFVIVGQDLFKESARYIQQLKKLVTDKGLEENFSWIDNTDQPADIIPAFDLLIHPALQEPFGRIICEAMAAGVPVIAADTGGPARIISDKMTGRLATDGESENFAEIAVELLQNAAERERLTENARHHVQQKYSLDRVCRKLIKLYDKLYQATIERREFKPDKD